MTKLVLSILAATILAAVAYAFGADITGSTIGAILFALAGFAIGWWVAMLVARAGRGRDDTVR